MRQVYEKPSNQDETTNYHSSRQLHISYHNPNTTEETAKYLAKLIVKCMLDQKGDSK